MSPKTHSRRQFGAIVAAGIVGFAGCLDDDSGGGNDTDNNDDGGGGGGYGG